MTIHSMPYSDKGRANHDKVFKRKVKVKPSQPLKAAGKVAKGKK